MTISEPLRAILAYGLYTLFHSYNYIGLYKSWFCDFAYQQANLVLWFQVSQSGGWQINIFTGVFHYGTV